MLVELSVVEQRYHAVMEVLAAGASKTEVAARYGVSRHAAASKAEAAYVQGVLERHCGFVVPVEPVLVFVGVVSLHRAVTQYTVRIYQEREVSALGPLSGRLTPDQAERVYAVARHRRAWLRP